MAWSKASRHERGYGTEWDRLREQILKRDKYVCVCQGCRAAGRVLPATHVDHIINKATWNKTRGTLVGVDHPSNLQSMNVDCHKLKTLLEKGVQPRSGCDRNGWPTDPNHPWNRKTSRPEPDGK